MAARKNESYVHLLDQMSPADLSVEVKDTLPMFVEFAKNVWGLSGDDDYALAHAGTSD